MPPPSSLPSTAAAATASAAFLRPSASAHPASASAPPNAAACLRRSPRRRLVAARAAADGGGAETVFFDGGAHYGDLAANLALGLTLLWLPLTLAAVSRAFILRYRFTSRRVSVISGLSGADRTDFPYSSVTSVVVVPRFIGEWGDIVITLKDGTKVELRSVPRFCKIAYYCRSMESAEEARNVSFR